MIEWRKLPGFARYSVSSDGRVRRDVRIYRQAPAELKQTEKPEGYRVVSLVADDGRYCRRYVHALVADAFIGPRQPGQVVRHRDGVRSNCSASNLSYGTHTDNAADAIGHGTQVRGSRQHLAVLHEMQVRNIKLAYIEGASPNALAEAFEVSRHTIHDIVKGRTWQHVEPAGDIRRRRVSTTAQPQQLRQQSITTTKATP